jgi:PAS domain S-box-containing protein
MALVAWLGWLQQQRSKQVIAELQRSRQQLREAQRLAQIGSWELDIAGNRLFWSEELYRIFEMDPKDGPGDYERFLQIVHPEDRERVDQAYRNALRNREPYEVEHRMITADGHVRQIRERGESSYDEDGKPLRSIGTAQDITDIRRMESQMQLLGTAFHHSGEAIMITDDDNRIVTVNPAFTTLTGYSQQEVVGRNPSMLSAGRTKAADYEKMWTAIVQKGYWQGEVWDRRKDGGVYPKWLSISVMRDDEGSIRYYIAHFTDVSAERATEARLHHMAHHDMLTGLHNRFSLKDRLEHALALARREFKWKLPTVETATFAIVGGILMGIGARLAMGCNIGAFFATVTNGDPSGWVFLLGMVAGGYAGVKVFTYWMDWKMARDGGCDL